MPGTQKVHTGAHTHTPDRGKHSVLWIPIEGLQPGQDCPGTQQVPVTCSFGKSGRSQDYLGTQKVPNKSSLPSICRKFVTHRAHNAICEKLLVLDRICWSA